jgi:hypothetical protein
MDNTHHNGHGPAHDKGQHHTTSAIENIPVSRGVSFLIRKAEKLTTALYMVTDIMSDRDPMKWKVREIAVDVLSDITVSAHSTSAERMSVFRSVMRKVERVVSFLEIAETAQMMSEMNSTILRKEYLGLKDAIEAEWHHIYDDSKRILARAVVSAGEVKDTSEAPIPATLTGTSTREEAELIDDGLTPVMPPTPAPRFSLAEALAKKEERKDEEKEELNVDEHLTAPLAKEEHMKIQFVAPKREPVTVTPGGSFATPKLHIERLREGSLRPEVIAKEAQKETSKEGQAEGRREERGLKDAPTPRAYVPASRPDLTPSESTPKVLLEKEAPKPFGEIRKNTVPQASTPTTFERPRPRLIDMHDDGNAGFGRARSENDRDDRRKIILALIKQKPSLTVKDIVKSIPNVSEKTIQRELLAMVAEGILSKRGERRWSTYSLRDE